MQKKEAGVGFAVVVSVSSDEFRVVVVLPEVVV